MYILLHTLLLLVATALFFRHSLHASPTGNGNYTVRQVGSNYGNRVQLVFRVDGAASEMTCTCGYPARWLMPCCDVIAVGRCEWCWLPHLLRFMSAADV